MDFDFSDSDPDLPLIPSCLAPSIPESLEKLEILIEPEPLHKTQITNFEFNKQYYTFENYGYATNPNNHEELLISPSIPLPDKYKSVYEKTSTQRKQHRKELKANRLTNDDPGSSGFSGPWANYKGEETLFEGRYQEITEEQKAKLGEYEEKRQRKIEHYKENPIVKDYEKTKLVINEPRVLKHIEALADYQGRSMFIPPSDLKANPSGSAYIPKKCVQTLAGHTQGVQCIKYHKEGHLMLSCSLDHTVKIWDAIGTKKCIQTYMGHTNSVRDLCWSQDCTSFVSCSYDRIIRHWDTETGKVLCTFTCRRIPYCIRFNPDPEKSTAFIVGTANKKIVEYNINTGKKERTYEEHLGAVNSICFLDDNKKFISTSDDKKIFLWEFGIPVVAKHISEPNLHAVPYTALHPNNRHFVGQSLDNRLVVFEARGGFRLNRRKKFVGHMNGGFACAVSFSPDGQFVTSGDANGRLWFWDWQTTKNYRTIEAHNDVVIGVDWHPILPSVVASCSWDGVIKIWD